MEGFLKCDFYFGRLGVEGSSFWDDSVQSEMAIQDCAICVYLHNCNWILSHLWPSLSLRPFANWRRSIHTVRISLSLLPSCRLHSLSLSLLLLSIRIGLEWGLFRIQQLAKWLGPRGGRTVISKTGLPFTRFPSANLYLMDLNLKTFEFDIFFLILLVVGWIWSFFLHQWWMGPSLVIHAFSVYP